MTSGLIEMPRNRGLPGMHIMNRQRRIRSPARWFLYEPFTQIPRPGFIVLRSREPFGVNYVKEV